MKIEPAGTTATLTIKTKPGGSGTAIFQSTGNATRTVTDTKTVTIVGRNISNGPRDVFIEVKVAGDVIGTWDFTVFRIDVTTLLTGDVSTQLPATVKNYVGTKLQDVFKDGNAAKTKLGHQHLLKAGALDEIYGGVVFKGKIVPSGMAAGDFNTAHTRSASFNWGRTGTFRTWTKVGDPNKYCLDFSSFSSDDPRETAVDEIRDDDTDFTEDCTPADDGTAGELFIWSIDTPSALFHPGAVDGYIARLRYNFTESVSYAGIKAGVDVKWNWRTSTKTNAVAPKFVELADVTGDNKIEVGHTKLNWELKDPSTPAFTLTDWTPVSQKRKATGSFKIQFFKVTGTGLKPTGINCKPVVVITRTDGFNTYSITSMYRSKPVIINHTSTSFEGIIDAPMQTIESSQDPNITGQTPMLGVYAIDVYIGEQHLRYTNKTFTLLPP